MLTESRTSNRLFQLFFKLLILIIFMTSSLYSSQDLIKVYGEETGLNEYSVNAANTKSLDNAKSIANRLEEITGKPVYIKSLNGNFLVQIGYCRDIKEAESVKTFLIQLELKIYQLFGIVV